MSKEYEVHGRRVTPVYTIEQMEAAKASGARIEYTGCGCNYDEPGEAVGVVGGWIISDEPGIWFDGHFTLKDGRDRLRAIYPVWAEVPAKPSILSRVRRFFAGAKEAA